MEFIEYDLTEAQRQIASTVHKLRETIKTLESKENAERYKPQITLAKRRVKAFEIAGFLIKKELGIDSGFPPSDGNLDERDWEGGLDGR